MTSDLRQIYSSLYQYCEGEVFAGWDPFDGLNSRVFLSTPLQRIAAVRFAWQQVIKRSPANLRPLLLVKKGSNAKALALFALAELSMFRYTGDEQHHKNAAKLLDMLRGLAITGVTSNGEPTKAFGYNFDWQSRVFYAPKGTPTIVPTAFAALAFVESYKLFCEENDLEFAKEICGFILNELETPYRTEDEICFSYKPNDTSLIYNASLLAGETLAAVGAIISSREMRDAAAKAMRFVLRRQGEDGSWLYGPGSKHQWIDNFHTAFVLSSLNRINENLGNEEAAAAIRKGLGYWIDNFFLDDGTPKYFDRETYPIDIHSAGAAIATLSELKDLDELALPLAEKLAGWTIANLRDPAGFFYYQKRRSMTVKTPFMRWGQAWMAYGLSKLIEAKN